MLKLLHSRNTKCYHDEKYENPAIRVIEYEEGRKERLVTHSNILLMVLRGSGKISFRQFVGRTITSGDILLLPVHTQVRFRIEERAVVLAFQLQPSISFCDHFSLESLYGRKNKKEKEKFITLKINQRIKSYINSLLPCLVDGLKCHYFLELKTKELFFILRAYHAEDDIADFFLPMITEDADFYAFVLANYKSVKTVGELAKKAGYTVSGFEKLFKRVFGVTAYAWMREQLSANLFHEITCTRKTFIEIGKMLGFSSSAHLSNFCKLNFGVSPTDLRKNRAIKAANKGLQTTDK